MRAKHRPVSVGNVAKGIIDKVVTISLKDKPVLLGRVTSLLAMKRTKPDLYVETILNTISLYCLWMLKVLFFS